MMNHHILECRPLPAINETFPQFNSRPISLLSPLDLSLRAAGAIPITPPSTPSPPRKRQRLMSDENYLWRPHVMETSTTTTEGNRVVRTMAVATGSSSSSSYFQNMTYASEDELVSATMNSIMNSNNKKPRNLLERNNFEEIPESQPASREEEQQEKSDLATIYVDDDTILLTEDEDETLVSSHDYAEDADEELDEEADEELLEVTDKVNIAGVNIATTAEEHELQEEEDEEEYVDILSNDDDELSPLKATALLRLQSQVALEEVESTAGRVLTRNKLVYEDEQLHNQAIDGLAKLFERDFRQQCSSNTTNINKDTDEAEERCEKTYTDLTTGRNVTALQEDKKHHQETNSFLSPVTQTQSQSHSLPLVRPPKTYKSGERKRMKLRKHMSALDEDTISPVSGTIIRKLRDDEELVVRKGDIDPAFNVVEITEEAKAILASIDNKIGDYLCQLCRTLYDDAFQLAQHRCPRIVHIEYKCSECEKVFNCPANLASHRRWHKPKSELLANSGQTKKRHSTETTHLNLNESITKPTNGESNTESPEGIFPCHQCGKTFRRHAYLKKHHVSHQMLDNLKSLDIFKNSVSSYRDVPTSFQPNTYRSNLTNATATHQPHAATSTAATSNALPTLYHPSQQTSANQHPKLYPQRFGAFPFPPFEQRQRFYTLEDLYLTQQHLERSSAFQYVQATHLRHMSSVGNGNGNANTNGINHNNFLARPVVPSLLSMSVK